MKKNNTILAFVQTYFPWRFGSCLFLSAILCGCSIINIDTMHNEPLPHPMEAAIATRASQNITIDDLPNGVFIGIGLSGGGSRAGNFSAAAMLELEKLGILQKTSVISSVSGSSLVAAYYGLYGNNNELWNPSVVRDRFLTDFELPWMARWLNPWNVVRYWFTNLNRSDIMRQELDNALFDEKQFKDMEQGRWPNARTPRILINATSYTNGQPFIFSDEQFKDSLKSRLDTYPIANAVMASSSFPVVFHDVTLNDYSLKDISLPENRPAKETQNYEHLIDGGPSDNLGTTTLIGIVDKLYKVNDPKKQPNACFLFVVDAFPHQEYSEDVKKIDTRHWYDFILDTNVATSSDILLTTRRVDLMKELGVDVTDENINPYMPALKVADHKTPITQNAIAYCTVWHLTFQRLSAPHFETIIAGSKQTDKYRQMLLLRRVVNATPTRYKLSEVEGYAPETVQDYLFKAANILIRKDKMLNSDKPIVQDICDRMWVYDKDLKCQL